MEYTNWERGEPNDSGGTEECVESFLNPGRGWNDLDCNGPRHWICRIPKGMYSNDICMFVERGGEFMDIVSISSSKTTKRTKDIDDRYRIQICGNINVPELSETRTHIIHDMGRLHMFNFCSLII